MMGRALEPEAVKTVSDMRVDPPRSTATWKGKWKVKGRGGKILSDLPILLNFFLINPLDLPKLASNLPKALSFLSSHGEDRIFSGMSETARSLVMWIREVPPGDRTTVRKSIVGTSKSFESIVKKSPLTNVRRAVWDWK